MTEGVYFRFPPGLYDRVKLAARERDCSANSEVVRRLEESFDVGRLVELAYSAGTEGNAEVETFLKGGASSSR